MDSTPLPLDAYVWLDGRPLLVLRTPLDATSGTPLPASPSCPRNGESSPCGLFALVPDVSAAPLLVLDSNRLVAAAPVLPPYGDVDSRLATDATPQPIASPWLSSLDAGTPTLGTSIDVRADFSSVDTCDVSLVDASGALLAPVPSGPHLGRVLSPWVPLPADGVVSARVGAACPQPNLSGAALHSWRFRVSQSGASWFLPPLRFPGQFADDESGLLDNWHRVYAPRLGLFLSPEPLLQSPTFTTTMATRGLRVPAYVYALNNPLRYVDLDGLRPINNLGDVVARYMDVARAYGEWQKTQMSPVTPWPQLLYAENWVRALAGRQQRFLPGAQGDGACGGAARSFADYLRRNVDMEDVAVREPTGPWTVGDSHTTVRVSFHARDGSSSMDLGFDPFNAGVVPDGIEAGRSEFRVGNVAVQTIAPLGGVGWFR